MSETPEAVAAYKSLVAKLQKQLALATRRSDRLEKALRSIQTRTSRAMGGFAPEDEAIAEIADIAHEALAEPQP